jgi:hypothetical protein
MFELARGREQVEALEAAIGSPPPSGAVEQAREELLRLQTREREAREAVWANAADSSRQMRELMIAQVAPEGSELAAAIASRRRTEPREEPSPFSLPEPATEPTVEPRFAVGSIQLVKSAPYTDHFTAWHGAYASVSAASERGSYGFITESQGQGTSAATAGVCLAYNAPVTNPAQRVSAYVHTSWSWEDNAAFYVGHNKAWTRLCVWGVSEQRWVLVQPVEPAWNDSVAWLEQHRNSAEGETPRVEGFFPARAGNSYIVFISSEGAVYADGGAFGWAYSFIGFTMDVRFFVFGSA